MKIIGTGSALPKKVVMNDDLAQFLDTSDEWILPRTGIRSRHNRRTPGGSRQGRRPPRP